MSKIYLSVVVPCYNERQNLLNGVLDQLHNYLSAQKYTYEVIVSDDESTDGSLDLVKKARLPHFKILQNPHGGKAFALRSGLNQAQGEYTLFTDMDQSTPISEIAKLLPHTKKFPVVIGSRGSTRKNFSIWRKLASNLFGAFRRTLILPQIIDTQCGFKLTHTKIGREIFQKMTIFSHTKEAKGWTVAAWDVEFLFLARKYGHNIAEVPVEWQDNDESTSKNRTASKFIYESIDMLKQILRVRLNDLKGFYV